ncbi:hypothetical protein F4X86_04325 [Candidatus Saccharibacteria bacterium]|nr:hypothetical protein [Candidatus Saccharibacteria bacterium]
MVKKKENFGPLFTAAVIVAGVILITGLVWLFGRGGDSQQPDSSPQPASSDTETDSQSVSSGGEDSGSLLSSADKTDEEKYDAVKVFCFDAETAPGCLVWSNECATVLNPDHYLTGDPAQDCQIDKTGDEYCISSGWCGDRAAYERWLELRQRLEDLGLQDESQPFPNPSNPYSRDWEQVRNVYVEHEAAVFVAQNSLKYYFLEQESER